MSNAPEALLLDLVEWVARAPRSYEEVMEAWRTSCPRLPVWEDAVERGLVLRRRKGFETPHVLVTAAGMRFLGRHGRATRAA